MLKGVGEKHPVTATDSFNDSEQVSSAWKQARFGRHDVQGVSVSVDSHLDGGGGSGLQTGISKQITDDLMNRCSDSTRVADAKSTGSSAAIRVIDILKKEYQEPFLYYEGLAIKRQQSDEFEFNEIRPFIKVLRTYLSGYIGRDGNSEKENQVFSRAIKDCDQLIVDHFPYQRMLKKTGSALAIIDYHRYSRTFRKMLDGKGFSGDFVRVNCGILLVPPDGRNGLLCSLRDYDDYSDTGCVHFYINESDADEFSLRFDNENNALFCYYPDSWEIEDVYERWQDNMTESSKMIFDAVYDNRSIILFPSAESIGIRTFSMVLRFPFWPLSVSVDDKMLHRKKSTPLYFYYHDIFHASMMLADHERSSIPLPKFGWGEKNNPFIHNWKAIKKFYTIYFERLDQLEKDVRKVGELLLFYFLHENTPYTYSYQLPYLEESADQFNRDVSKLEFEINVGNYLPYIKKEWSKHIKKSRDILLEAVRQSRALLVDKNV